MNYAFYSSILAFKYWKRCPLWMGMDGKEYRVTLILSSEKLNKQFWRNFLKYNQKIYPDLMYICPVKNVIKSGVQKPKPVARYQELN